MPGQNVELIQRAYDAFARGYIPEVMSVLADDIEWHVPAVLPQGMPRSSSSTPIRRRSC